MNDKLTRSNLWLVVALVIPIFAIVGLIARSEILLRGQEWRFRVRGYDPRDLLRGNYIDLNIEWNAMEGASSIPWDQECLCLQRTGEQRRVTELSCVDTTPCNVRLNNEERRELARFYIPEDPQRARELERVLAKARGELVLIEKMGKLSVKDLLIDGRSWKLYSETATAATPPSASLPVVTTSVAVNAASPTQPANQQDASHAVDFEKPGPVVVSPPIVFDKDISHAKAFGWANDSSELGVCAETERTSAYECKFLKPGGKLEEVTDFHRDYGVDASDTQAMQARVTERGYGVSAVNWPYASELTLTWKSACDEEASTCVLRVGAVLQDEAPVYPILIEENDVDRIHPETIAISHNGKWVGVVAHGFGGNGDSQYKVRVVAVSTLVSQVYNDTGLAHHKRGDFTRSAQLFQRAVTVNPQNQLASYNYACALAKQAAPGTAQALKAAITIGGHSVKQRALKDPDFASVAGEAWFVALTK